MQITSRAKMKFKVVDYTQFNSGYVFRIIDNTVSSGYQFVYVPHGRYPGISMLEFMMGEVERGSFINEALIEAVIEETEGLGDDIVILGEKQGYSGTYIHGTEEFTNEERDIEIVTPIDGERIKDLKWLHKINQVKAKRGVRHRLGINKIEGYHRPNTQDIEVSGVRGYNRYYLKTLGIAQTMEMRRESHKGANILPAMRDFKREYLHGATKGNSSQGKRVHISGLIKSISMGSAHREYVYGGDIRTPVKEYYRVSDRSATVNPGIKDYERDIYTEGVVGKDLLRLDREITNDMCIGGEIDQYSRVTTKDMVTSYIGQYTRKINNKMYLEQPQIGAQREQGKITYVSRPVREWKLVARQYPTDIETTNLYDKWCLRDMVIDKGITMERDIRNNPSVIDDILGMQGERGIFSNLSLDRGNKRFKRDHIVKANIFNEHLYQYGRDIRSNMYMTNPVYRYSREYIHEATLYKELSRHSRDNKVGGVIESTVSKYSRDIISGMCKGISINDGYTRDSSKDLYTQGIEGYGRNIEHGAYKLTTEGYKRDITTGMVVPKELGKGAQRRKEKLLEVITSEGYLRDNKSGMYLPKDGVEGKTRQKELVKLLTRQWERTSFVDIVVQEVQGWGREDTGQLSISRAENDYVRDIRKTMHLRDKWFNTLIKDGGNVGVLELDGLLMDEMLFAEIMNTPAWIEDYMEYGNKQDREGIIDESYLGGITEKVVALIEGGILEGTIEKGYAEVFNIDPTAIRAIAGGWIEHPRVDAYKGGKEFISTEDDTVYGHRGDREGNLEEITMADILNSTGYIVGTADGYSKGDAEGYYEDLLLQAKQSDKEAEITSITVRGEKEALNGFKCGGSVIGKTGDLGGYTVGGDITGETDDRSAVLSEENKYIGLQEDKHADRLGEGAKEGHLEDKGAYLDRGGVQAGIEERYGYTPGEDTLAQKEYKEGTVDSEWEYGEQEEKLAQSIVNFVYGTDESRSGDYLNEIYLAITEDRGALLSSALEGSKEAMPSELSIDILGLNEKFGEMGEENILGRGVLDNYDNDLLKEGMDVEGWDKKHGFGVPDDYDPMDPFNNYFPYTSDYTSYELAQNVDWETSGKGWEFKPNTDIIKLVPEGKEMATAGVAGSDYKFSVDFRVTGNKDKAVDIIVKQVTKDIYYMFRMSGGDQGNTLNMTGPMQLYKVSYGEREEIGSPMAQRPWEIGKWHKVGVTVMGSDKKIIIHVDGRLQYDIRGY